MNLEKIKEFVLEKKQYFIIGVVVIGIFFWMKKDNSSLVDNSSVLNEKTEQSSERLGASSNQSSSPSQAVSQSSIQSKTITCDITGAVKHQGVYTLKNGARLQELIDAAGGAKENAQLKAVNRAVLLKDQDKIHIPYKGEKVDNATSVSSSNVTSSESSVSQSDNSGDKVNLNTASAQELQKLNGIGQKRQSKLLLIVIKMDNLKRLKI